MGHLHYLQSQQSRGPNSHSPRYQEPELDTSSYLELSVLLQGLLRAEPSLQAKRGDRKSGEGYFQVKAKSMERKEHLTLRKESPSLAFPYSNSPEYCHNTQSYR